MLRLTWKIAIALLVLGLARPILAQTGVKISELLRDPKAHSEQQIVVFGNIRELARWDQFDTFMLCKAKCINILAWGHPRISDGQDLNVRGRFHLLKEINHHKVRYVLEVAPDSLGFSPSPGPATAFRNNRGSDATNAASSRSGAPT